MTAADLEAFLDGFMPMQLERENLAGAVVLIVKDNKVLFAKGYGYMDVKAKKPVSVDGTLFRPGSISKLFTWTSVMQLVEQGKLDLDRDVNDYLDFKLPSEFGKPITLRNIMTHTPGFEETIRELWADKDSDLKPLGDYLRTHIPAQIFPPGTTPAYSNYATAVAGYIVQRVSGERFEDYVRNHIFQPLDMQHATFEQPLPKSLQPLMSKGYLLGSGDAKPFEDVQVGPAGALSITAADISHFIMAHLNDGKYGSAQILKPETVKLMHSRSFGLSPEMNGMCLGFYEESRNGHRIIGHGGDTIYFHSDLHLMQDANLGFFVSYNSAGKHDLSPRTALWRKILDRYFPYQPPAGQQPASAAQDAQAVSGYYMTSRRSQKNFLYFGEAIQQIYINRDSAGTISSAAFKDFNGEKKRFREIGPMLFREENGQDLLAFRTDETGNLQMLVPFPATVFARTHGLTTASAENGLLRYMIAVLALAIILWPLAAIVRRHYGCKLALAHDHHRLRLMARLVCIIQLIFFGALFAALSASDSPFILSGRLVPLVIAWETLGVFAAAGSLFVIYYAIRCWVERRWLWTRIFESGIALAAFVFVFIVLRWNMINFNFHY
jgi:CubicO group peptidase (beta-lactamase class C family)